MAIDTSIYSNIQQPQTPDIMGAMQKGMSLSQLAMQSKQAQYQMAQTQAVRQAFARNTDANGTVDKQGVLADLGKNGMGQAALGLGQDFSAQEKSAAEAKGAQMDSMQKVLSQALPRMNYLAGLPEEQRSAQYNDVMKGLAQQGVPMDNIPKDAQGNFLYDPGHFRQSLGIMQNTAANIGNQNTQANTGKAIAETNKLRAETPKPFNGPVDANTDPSALVSSVVPKDHQAKVFDEIKTAQDIKALTPKILAAFQKGSSRNPNEAAQGQREFEGLINTTVKDTEGTARQAAFDSIHKTMTPSGLLALPGENEAKMRTVQEYLNSKASAPTAKGYNIDLGKFASTSPYQLPAKAEQPESGTAYAAERPQPSQPAQPKKSAQSAQTKYRAAGASVSDNEVGQYAIKHNMKASDAKNYLRSQGYAVD